MPGGNGFRQATNGQSSNYQPSHFGGQFDGPDSDASHRGSALGSLRPAAMNPGHQGRAAGAPSIQPQYSQEALAAARDFQALTQRKESIITNRRVELPAAAYQLDKTVSRDTFVKFYAMS